MSNSKFNLGSAEAITIKVPEGPNQITWRTSTAKNAIVISTTGEVLINWKLVEEWLAKPEQYDLMARAALHLAIAVRDGTWKPLENKE